MPRWLIYGLADPRTGHIHYIGKSSTGMLRPRQHQGKAKEKNPAKAAWIRSLADAGMTYQILVLEECESGKDLNEAEIKHISRGRADGWPLTNLTRGGDGGPIRSGQKNSPETRARISASKKGKPARPDVAARLRTIFSGRKHRQETIEKMSLIKRGKIFSETTRARMSAAAKMRFQTEDGRAHLARLQSTVRERLRGRRLSPTARAKISSALKGKPRPYVSELNKLRTWTPEMREKASASAIRRHRAHMRINLLPGARKL